MPQHPLFHLANTLSEAVLIVAADGTIQTVNRQVETALGVSATALLGRALADIVDTPAPQLQQYLRSCLRSPDIVPGAFTLTGADGQQRLYRCEGALLQARSATTDAWVMLRLFPREPTISPFTMLNEKLDLLNREIERRKQVEQTLRDSEARKSAMLAIALDAIITIDHEGKIVEFNPAAEAMFGYNSQDALGQKMAELLVPPALRESHYRAFHQYLVTGEGPILGQRIELSAMRADGSEFPVELAISTIQVETQPMFTAYIRDITEHKNNLATLHEQLGLAAFGRDVGLAVSQAKNLRTMLQRCAELMVHHLDGVFARIWTVNDDEQVLELQASAGLYTNLDGAHSRIPVGQYKIGLIAASQQPHLTNAVLGDPHVHDQEWVRQLGMVAFAGYPLIVDGRVIGVMAMFARQPLSESTLVAMTSVANDIALGIERKRIEQVLRRQTTILLAMDRRKDEFLAMLAHELRNPLVPIRTGLELLQLEMGDTDTHDTIALMQEQVDHLVRMVDDLLDVSRIMRGRIELRKQYVRLRDVLHRATTTVQPLIAQNAHTLVVSAPEAAIWLHADPVRLAQVFSNLLHNAAKYTPDGGRIEIDVQCADGQTVVRVRDNGLGIEADFLPELFELFTQANHALDRSMGGLGIGLKLVRRLVELHDGRISAHSAGIGQGSTFVLRLPTVTVPDEVPAADTNPAPTAVSERPHYRILVVDDNVSSVKVMRLILGTRWQHEVATAYDGFAAVEVAQTFRPDIVFLDIGLPGMNGFEVAQKLRQQPALAHTLLVALTGYGTEEDRYRSHAAGFDLHLVKPVTTKVLQRIITQYTKA